MDILLRDQSATGVLTLTLHRPERKNAIDLALAGELVAALAEAEETPSVRVVVLAGAGDGFCSGGDLVGGDDSRHVLGVMRQISQPAVALHRFSKPTIARVHGVAAGAGWNLALGCDLVVAADDARFCQIFIRRGLSLDYGGSWLLPRLVGLQRAKQLALLGGFVSASEAQAMGLVNRVVPRAELDAAVAEWAEVLAAGPPIALAISKRMLQESGALGFEGAIEIECSSQCVNLATQDTREGFRAFFEKRKPRFEGR
jgi:2-(1,2-epoxy-1,2-dihydrophenyl)acetyl-CoA isomerase